MEKTAVMFLADGVEECEALIVVDVLRRAGVEVIMASVMGRKEIRSVHGVGILTDALAEDVDFDAADMVILPGGFDGTEVLGKSELVKAQCRSFAEDRLVAAICATPGILAGLGLLDGKRVACHPAVEEKMKGAVLTGEGVTRDGNIITGKSLGTAFPFALKLVEACADADTAAEIAGSIFYNWK